jgi:hypothetical protein
MMLIQDTAPVEVVVVAKRRKCDTSVAGRVLSDREFSRRAAEWAAGTPVRVVVPTRADIRCLARITFRLADKGVRNVEFVDPAP